MQMAEISVLRSNKDYSYLTFIEHFLGGNDSIDDLNEDFSQETLQ